MEIAGQYGAKVVQHLFENQAQQFNWAIDNLDIKNEWILRLDADEYLTEELKEEMQQEASKDYKFRIFEVNNKHELNPVTSFIVNDKSLALIKMHKFTGDTNELKETLMERKDMPSSSIADFGFSLRKEFRC